MQLKVTVYPGDLVQTTTRRLYRFRVEVLYNGRQSFSQDLISHADLISHFDALFEVAKNKIKDLIQDNNPVEIIEAGNCNFDINDVR